jgi:acyl carrier protein
VDESLSRRRHPAAAAGHDAGVLRAWLIEAVRRAPGYDGTIDDETPLGDDGVGLDSVALLRMIAAIEEYTGLVISEDEITEAHFGTVGRLLRFLSGRC